MNDRSLNTTRQRRTRLLVMISALALAVLACTPPSIQPTATPTPDLVDDNADLMPTITPTALPTITPTAEPLALPSPLPTLTPYQTPTPSYLWSSGEIRVYPGPRHFVGDTVTVEVVIFNPGQLPEDANPRLAVDDRLLSDDAFTNYSPLRDDVLVFRWVWDTTGLPQRQYRLTATLPPTPEGEKQVATVVVNLEAASARPAQEQTAAWVRRNTPTCCQLSAITNTAAMRDIETLSELVEDAVDEVGSVLGEPVANRPVPFTFIDNVWGNGGYASGREIVVSYLDRPYMGLNVPTVLRHEVAHWAMRDLGTRDSPIMLSEGIATYAAGGHYYPGSIPQRAAALRALDRYVPLEDLTNNFREHQHEAAYLQAAGLVAYLVEEHGGSEPLVALYGLEGISAASPAQWLDRSFREVYGLTLAQVEAGYIEWLAVHDPGDEVEYVQQSILLHETIRRYQDQYYQYQEALPPIGEAIDANQVSEYMREPTTNYNLTLETLFIEIARALRIGQYERSNAMLLATINTLDTGDFTQGIVGDYLAIVEATRAAGYEVQTIRVDGDRATAIAIDSFPELTALSFTRGEDGGWVLVE